MEFWQNKKVLLTGHTGFKGSWLSLWLSDLGAKVFGFALPPKTNPNLYNALSLGDRVDSFINDIRDQSSCEKVMKEIMPEIVIHMAAQPLVRESYKYPVYTFETNIMGTVNVLQAARNCNSIKSILVITTDKCYENIEKDYAYSESDALGGYDPYSSSKACAEHVASAYYRSYFKETRVGLATARAGNVIGGGDWSEDRLIPDIIRAFKSNSKLIVRNPMATRPWQHVMEPLSGYLQLCEHLWKSPNDYSGAWNFGPDNESVQNVGAIVEYSAKIWGDSPKWEINNAKELHEATLLHLNSDKAMSQLLWKPKLDYKRALELTIEWYRTYYSGREDMILFTQNQLKEYAS